MRGTLNLNSTVVRLGLSPAEGGLEKVQQRGPLEVEFGQELLGEEGQSINLTSNGDRQSIVIVDDVIVRIKTPLNSATASLDFTDVKTGEVLRE